MYAECFTVWYMWSEVHTYQELGLNLSHFFSYSDHCQKGLSLQTIFLTDCPAVWDVLVISFSRSARKTVGADNHVSKLFSISNSKSLWLRRQVVECSLPSVSNHAEVSLSKIRSPNLLPMDPAAPCLAVWLRAWMWGCVKRFISALNWPFYHFVCGQHGVRPCGWLDGLWRGMEW